MRSRHHAHHSSHHRNPTMRVISDTTFVHDATVVEDTGTVHDTLRGPVACPRQAPMTLDGLLTLLGLLATSPQRIRPRLGCLTWVDATCLFKDIGNRYRVGSGTKRIGAVGMDEILKQKPQCMLVIVAGTLRGNRVTGFRYPVQVECRDCLWERSH